MTRSATLFALLAASTLSSSVAAKSLNSRTICLLDKDCLIPDIWSLVGCQSGACVKTCKSGCQSTGSGCAPTTPVQSCPSGQGWNPLTHSCINILTDFNHCGGYQNVCGSDPLADVFCSGGTCQKTCHSSCSKDSTGTCVPSQPSACGSTGKSCPAPTSNGVATCSSGACGIQCNSGFTLSGNDCVLSNTPQSCGVFNVQCPSGPSGTTATCTNGVCGIKCTNGGVYNSLSNSCATASNYCGIFPLGKTCGAVANGQSYCNGLNCEVSCNGGYVSSKDAGLLGFSANVISTLLGGGSSSTGCIPVDQNNAFCGLTGKTCATSLPNCVSNCYAGSCQISGAPGYTYSPLAGGCVATNSISNCGALGYACYAPPNSTPSCKTFGLVPICSYTCNNGYSPFLHYCVPNQTSMRAKAKRQSKASVGFCPENEEACPISGSNSLKQALIGEASGNGFLQYAAPTGGYECLDTQTSLESCGGCASTGAGQDCTSISRAKTMGCDAGQCVVFECERGFRPNDNMTACERLPSKSHKRPFSLTHKAGNSRAQSFHHKLSL